jgi:hypothetical protein
VYREILNDGEYQESLMPVNYVMLAVISGIIGIVLAGFTGWHILLASRGQTTIECLEKTRYLSPLWKSIRSQRALPGVNGESEYVRHPVAEPDLNVSEELVERHNGGDFTRQQYDAYERQRARDRYEEYLDEQDAEKLPSAFDLGWRANLLHLFGKNRALWAFPVSTTTGNGWSWEPSPKWLAAREMMARERDAQRTREYAAGWGEPVEQIPRKQVGAARHYVNSYPTRQLSKADRILGRMPEDYTDVDERTNNVSMQNLQPRGATGQFDDVSDDGDEIVQRTVDRAAAAAWPQKVGLVTNTLLGNTLSRQKDDSKAWVQYDDGVD